MKDVIRLVTLFAALLLIVPAAGADWSENFDSYTLGGLHGQGGWAGWEGNSAYDAFVVDTMSLSPNNSVAIIPTSDIVHEFTETAGEWEMTAWGYIPTGSTGKTFFIMLNSYHPNPNKWSVQITFDTDAGTLNTQGGSTAAIIFDQWVEVKVEIYLDSNAKNLYYNGGFLESKPWQSGGVDEIAALDLFSDGGSTIFWDDCNLINTSGALEQTTWGNIKTIMQ